MKRGVVSLTSSLLNLLKAIIRIVCKCAKYPLQVVIALFRLLRLHSSRHSRPRRPSHTDDDTRKLEEGTPTIRVSTAGQSLQHPLILPSMDHSHSLPSRLLPSSTTPERHEYDLPPPAEANLQDQDLREADIVDHRLDISQEVVVPIPSLYPPPPPTANSHRSGHTDETCVEEDEEGQEGGSGGEDRPGHVAVQMFDQPDVDILGDPAGRNVAEREPERDEGGDDIDPFIYPILPSDITRYDRQRYIDPSRHASYTVRARQMGDDFLDEVLPNGWVKLIHPEGLPYFWHPEERILTESWICDTEVMNHLNEFICRIRDYERAANVIQTENVSLVLQLVIEDDEDWWCGYYFANHADLSLYWHEDFKIDNKLGEVKGDITNSFAKLFLEREYWNHWALYPHACEATLKVIRIVETALTDAGTDIITSFNSNVNMNFDTVGSMLSLLGRAKGARLVENENGSSTPKDDLPAPSAWMIGRFMLMLSRDRFLNYYGQKHARLDRRQSVFGNPSFCSLKDPTILFRVLSPLLFCAPDVHLNTLEEIWVDKLTLLDLWNEFFARLCEEWKAQLVFASLLLTSNIGFLTMPMVSPEGAPSHGTFVQIASYVSTIASISSIVLGLLLSRHYQNHQNRDKVDARGLHKRMLSLHLETYGFQPLAVLYSLPYALLMWG
ncbi:hypothetical protein CC1G_05239 [Coprinopsis cinerea okayama7|uniref:WW domain-containing protein n=1 Tax=Coprinopsis cinerea (strain Okayama-7 / 130 / ATCC MYA-4618 / FGSC 9003) TaxID=240176 RepID=A8PCA7_COPC7|nr:hypothetical protein CC1G_05239 [Coprinopsis cinerea okayama7\|eukprot:XP_001840353.1 hypothetical protein CC1G_05239 [Coprinopsis cinerea okayama7\